MHPLVNTAIKAARRAGNIMVRHMDQLDRLDVRRKGRSDFVSEVDTLAEAEIIRVIHTAYPDHAIISEESGARRGNEFQWIIDPLDGTTNYLHGFPQFCVSIGVRRRNVLEHGVIFDPLRNEIFSASRGDGARLNERRIRVSTVSRLEDALLGTGFPFRSVEHIDPYLATFRSFLGLTSGVRRPGAAALDLAYVAAGRLDGFWELGLNVWDMAAGAVLIEEAGGLIADFAGGQDFLNTGSVLAATPQIFGDMLEIIRRRTAMSA